MHGSNKYGGIEMDSMITAAAQALAVGDPLGALNRVALRNDPPALALRGIAMAQLGELARAKVLVREAARAFGAKEPMSRARCIIAEAEIALATRDLGWPAKTLDAARSVLEQHGDRVNAAHARYLEIRRDVLIGNIDNAERLLAEINPEVLPASLKAIHYLLVAGIAMRRCHARAAHDAIAHAERAARSAGIHALMAEVESAARILRSPAARLIAQGKSHDVLLDDIEKLFSSKNFIVDACRYVVRDERNAISLATRPILFALARALGEAWPNDVPRNILVVEAFRANHIKDAKTIDESYRARLRVEIGRLRSALSPLADIMATSRGFALVPHEPADVIVLARPIEEKYATILAFLADGEPWSSSALALALGISQRTVQRALDVLAADGKIQSFGEGRSRRWLTPPLPGFATTLLLPSAFAD